MSEPRRISVVRGRTRPPDRVLLYGMEGVGKTSFAAAMPRPLFLDFDMGSARLDVARLGDPFDQDNPPPRSYGELVDVLYALRDGQIPEAGDRQTLVIDTLDKVEIDLIHPEATRRWKPEKDKAPPEVIADIGFQQGYRAALVVWNELLSLLDEVQRATRMGIVLLAHATAKPISNLGGEDFTSYEPALWTGKNANAAELVREWADAVIFATFDDRARREERKAPPGKVGKGFTTGARVLYTVHQGWAMAKNRCCLPETMPFSYAEYRRHEDAFYSGVWTLEETDPVVLRRMIGSHVRVVSGWPETPPDWLEKRFQPHLDAAGDDPQSLRKLYLQLNEKICRRGQPQLPPPPPDSKEAQ